MKNVGVIGCGNISGIYFKNMTTLFDNINVAACCDLDRAKAEAAAKEYGIERVLTTEQILSDPEIDIILNLTTPQQHFEICRRRHCVRQARLYGKAAVNQQRGRRYARAYGAGKRVYLGCAPDTFMGAGYPDVKS